MRRSLWIAGMLVAGCGDSLAQESGTGSSGSGGDSVSTTGGGVSSVPTGSSEAGDSGDSGEPPTGGETGPTPGESSETGAPAERCFVGSIVTSIAELTAAKLAGFDCITGDVEIQEGTGADLWFLAEIRSIGGGFTIEGPHSLVSLHGLEKLESIGGGLRVGQAPGLVDGSALAGLRSIGGTLEFRDAPVLETIDLGALSELGGSFEVVAGKLTTLDVTALKSVPGDLRLERTKLVSLAGLAGLTNIGDGLTLRSNDELVDLEGLAGVTQLDGLVRIDDNVSLVDLKGLEAVTKLAGLTLISNKGMTSLDGLQNLEEVGELELSYSNKLVTMAPLAEVTVSRLKIASNKALTSLASFKGSALQLEVIANLALERLAGLEQLVVVDGLRIEDNNALTGLAGLGGMGEAAGHVSIARNQKLQSLAGPSGPTSANVVEVVDNPLLGSLELLEQLATVGGLRIRGNRVASLIDLAALTSADDFVLVDANPELKGLAGLEKLVATPRLYVRKNPKLTGLAALQAGALIEVSEDYDVSGNALLPSCAAKLLHDKLMAPPLGFCFDNKVDACSGLGGCLSQQDP